MANNDVDAAIGLLSGTRFQNAPRREVQGGPSWAEITGKAATLVARAHDTGHAIDDEVLLTAYTLLARDDDYTAAARYNALARPLATKLHGARSRQMLDLVLDDRLLILSYLKAGGAIDFRGTDVVIDIFDMTGVRNGRPRASLAYDPELFAAFPLRLSRADRELLFEMGRFTLLPRAQWHDPAALRRAIASDDYLLWMDGSPNLYWHITHAVNALQAPEAVAWARRAGYKVTPKDPVDAPD
ncbi:hypothetical protein IMZ29_19700 [Achromobacter sp. GG226]|uniref:hypothetical protein n=1 Tax=Verticiella alkaliphila TaxID=2779529 RepID=UPI001C0E3263|nr:hypothetical protein [Verticiella sp. GG226]MBU4612686.1 hypothetical protein [Verticiella sp. GG226]